MDPQFLNMVCPFCVVVPYPPPVDANVNAALGSAFTSIVRVKTLAAVPLLLLTVSVTVVVGAVTVLYVTVCGPAPTAVAGVAPNPKFQEYVVPATVEVEVLAKVMVLP
jgi:hypothetical protein